MDERIPLKLNDYKQMLAERELAIVDCDRELERLRLVAQDLSLRLRAVRKAERNLTLEIDSRRKYIDLIKDRISKFYPEE